MSCIICLDSKSSLIANRYCTCKIHWHQTCWESYLATVNPPKCISCRKVLNLSEPVRPITPSLQQRQQPREPSELDMTAAYTIIQLLEASNQLQTPRPSAPPVETSYTPFPSPQPASQPQGLSPIDPNAKKIVQAILGFGIFIIFFMMMYYFVWKN